MERVGGKIESLGGTVTYDETSPDKPVVEVSLGLRNVTDADLACLKGLTKLKTLNLWQSQVTDAGLERLKGLTELESLDLSNTPVTGNGLEHLGLTINTDRNDAARGGDIGEISTEDSRLKAFVIPTNEELLIARDTLRVIKDAPRRW